MYICIHTYINTHIYPTYTHWHKKHSHSHTNIKIYIETNTYIYNCMYGCMCLHAVMLIHGHL